MSSEGDPPHNNWRARSLPHQQAGPATAGAEGQGVQNVRGANAGIPPAPPGSGEKGGAGPLARLPLGIQITAAEARRGRPQASQPAASSRPRLLPGRGGGRAGGGAIREQPSRRLTDAAGSLPSPRSRPDPTLTRTVSPRGGGKDRAKMGCTVDPCLQAVGGRSAGLGP